MSIYKDCDIRGVYGTELREADARSIGRAVGTLLQGRPVVVGGDVRLSTPALKEALIGGLVSCGAKVWDIQTLITPAMYYAVNVLGAYGGLMVTASHNPAHYNGIKLMLGNMPIKQEDIQRIRQIVEEETFISGRGAVSKTEVLSSYADSIVSAFPPGRLKLVLDCCDGAASLIAPQVAERLGHDVVPLFCGVDGSFPNRDPNPAVYSHLTALQAKVRETHADLGIAFDGDGDRVVFVDETGTVLPSETSFVILIRHTVEEGDSIVYDLKSSSVVADEARALGCIPLMERSGHAFIKRRFLDNQSALAGEISGHFFFRDLGYDDALYAAMKMASILQKEGRPVSEIVANIPKTLITPDMRVPVPYEEQPQIIEQMMQVGKPYTMNLMDGVRIEKEEGWLLVRKSVTEEVMTVRMEAKDWPSMKKLYFFLADSVPQLAIGCNPYLNKLRGCTDPSEMDL